MRPPVTYHDVRERRGGGLTLRVERWRMAGGRIYEKRIAAGETPVVRVSSGRRGIEMAGNTPRPLSPAELRRWRRETRMAPTNFEAHAHEMGVTTSVDGDVETLESATERLLLERDARSRVPRRVVDFRAEREVVFEQPLDVQGRHVPRIEIHRKLGRELWRDRILEVEFDAPVPEEVRRLWEALERGGA